MRPAEVGGTVARYRNPDHDPSGSLNQDKFLDKQNEH